MFNRKSIYYWKCDRPNAFYALNESGQKKEYSNLEKTISALLQRHFAGKEFSFRPAGGQGNHITYLVFSEGKTFFLRIEDGPEGDNYMGIEARAMDEVRAYGVKTPQIFAVDSSRKKVPFAYQIMEFLDCPDLNSIDKKGELDLLSVGRQIGENVACWQGITPIGYGPFDPACLEKENRLQGLHGRYQDYFLLNLDRHLDFLKSRKFLSSEETLNLRKAVKRHLPILRIKQGCLVHKDLALWNILGTKDQIRAFIDWDDCISGDPTDDLSLLACFHNREFMESVLLGYQNIRELPELFESRFWLHLLRNMIVKAVIRVGAGYFDRKDDFFLIGSGAHGKSLDTTPRERIYLAYSGLTEQAKMTDL